MNETTWGVLATDYSYETKSGTTEKPKGKESVCVDKTGLGQVYERDWN